VSFCCLKEPCGLFGYGGALEGKKKTEEEEEEEEGGHSPTYTHTPF
jgi:hypothetical protein